MDDESRKEKQRAAQKRWRERNKEKVAAAQAKWRDAHPNYFREHALAAYYADVDAGRQKCRDYYAANKAKVNAQTRRRREANPDKTREYNASYYERNRDALIAKSRAWREADPDRARAVMAAYAKANPEVARDHAKRRRAAIRGSLVEKVKATDIFERDKWRCYICGRQVTNNAPPRSVNSAELDHVIPLSAGGAHAVDNLRCACYRCNRIKGARRTPEEVRKRLANELEHGPTGLEGPDQGGTIPDPSASTD